MINFEDIIDFLAQKGVKSLHIEMHDSKLLNEEKEGLNRRFDELREREKETPIAPKTEPKQDAEKLKDRRTAEEKLCDEGIEKTSSARILTDSKPSGQVVTPVAEKITETITVSQSPVVEKTVVTQETNKDDPVRTVAEKPSVASNTAPKSVYAAFCDLVSKDDGSVTKEQRLELIAKMGLDDLLRVNNDFQLGLETDRPTEDIRADVAECF